MRFLCQVWVDETVFDRAAREEKIALDRDSAAHDRLLIERGILVMASPLAPPSAARTIRRRKGKTSVTDGPFAETKEHLGGFLVIEAADIEEAVRVAAEVPIARYTTIEVRELRDIPEH
ncbi:MAG: YciI family protein [Rhizobiales bacterium]|nr:YciI family protein [Hyphomicrobiales bacterium]